jgi:hypothetical protein
MQRKHGIPVRWLEVQSGAFDGFLFSPNNKTYNILLPVNVSGV